MFSTDHNHRYDAFTRKATSQYSLAFEKAAIIFNISAVLSCHAAYQSRADDTGLKTAYHSFQASAGMFTYINDNFLHAPSTDLSRDTVKALIAIMLAQAQEVFLDKQVADGKKPGFLAKLASQAAHLYSQASDGVQDNVAKGTFEKVWSTLVQTKASHLSSMAGYFQAITDAEGGIHGTAVARLQLAEKQSTAALNLAKSFPSSVPNGSNLTSDTGPGLVDVTRHQLALVQEKLTTSTKDNDFIYHQQVPAEASLSPVAKLPAAKAIPVSDLYQGQDIQRIIGPDIFQRIVPMSVTESASLYDEEKAKLVRAEAEKVESANGEMAASLDYLKLPGSLDIIKGSTDQGMEVDEEFRSWCEEISGHDSFRDTLDNVQEHKQSLLDTLEECTKQLDREESVCEKMRSKYGAEWTQQSSSRLTATLRSDIRAYRETIDEASSTDSQLLVTLRQHEAEIDAMRNAGESGEVDVLFQQAMLKAGSQHGRSKSASGSPLTGAPEGNLLDEDYGEGGESVAAQIAKVEELLRKLNLVKRDRMETLKDLKEKVSTARFFFSVFPVWLCWNTDSRQVHNDDISNVLILNKKSIANQEDQLFQNELEKFRPHQNRLLQTSHKQSGMMKELAKVYGDLLQDKRVRAEQTKHETLTRQRNAALSKYKKSYKAFKELVNGLGQARAFYMQMKDSVDSLMKNVETFVSNRRSEGAQLLSQIERDKAVHASGQEDREREKLKQLMERLSMEPTPTTSTGSTSPTKSRSQGAKATSSTSKSPRSPQYPASSASGQTPSYPYFQPSSHTPSIDPYGSTNQPYHPQGGTPAHAPTASVASEGYNPMAYFYQQPPISPPPNQQYFGSTQQVPYGSGYPAAASPPPGGGIPGGGQPQQAAAAAPPPPIPSHTPQQYMPPGYVPPPPPPRPSPMPYSTPQGQYAGPSYPATSGAGRQSQPPPPHGQGQGQGSQNDPWAGLHAWGR